MKNIELTHRKIEMNSTYKPKAPLTELTVMRLSEQEAAHLQVQRERQVGRKNRRHHESQIPRRNVGEQMEHFDWNSSLILRAATRLHCPR